MWGKIKNFRKFSTKNNFSSFSRSKRSGLKEMYPELSAKELKDIVKQE